jgi:hypothetical protein
LFFYALQKKDLGKLRKFRTTKFHAKNPNDFLKNNKKKKVKTIFLQELQPNKSFFGLQA